jgi:hypothetical protein
LTEDEDDGPAVFLRLGGTGCAVIYPGINIVILPGGPSIWTSPKRIMFTFSEAFKCVNVPDSIIYEVARVFTLYIMK